MDIIKIEDIPATDGNPADIKFSIPQPPPPPVIVLRSDVQNKIDDLNQIITNFTEMLMKTKEQLVEQEAILAQMDSISPVTK